MKKRNYLKFKLLWREYKYEYILHICIFFCHVCPESLIINDSRNDGKKLFSAYAKWEICFYFILNQNWPGNFNIVVDIIFWTRSFAARRLVKVIRLVYWRFSWDFRRRVIWFCDDINLYIFFLIFFEWTVCVRSTRRRRTRSRHRKWWAKNIKIRDEKSIKSIEICPLFHPRRRYTCVAYCY